ncbi:MAG: hypothetical protein ACRD0K_19350 [Egibacteraceae bacterium]
MARGHSQKRDNGGFSVSVYAGRDPLTGKERRITGTASAHRLLSEVDRTGYARLAAGRPPSRSLEHWLETADLELTTRCCRQHCIAAKIAPAARDVGVSKVSLETLDRFYAELRKRGGVAVKPLARRTENNGTPPSPSPGRCRSPAPAPQARPAGPQR